MNEIVAKEWIKQLRSGNYKQGKRRLRDKDDNCCCLGILCDIAPMVKWELSGKVYDARTKNNYSDAVLPLNVQRWADMKTSNGTLQNQKRVALSEYNDNGLTFDEIADVIEENWKEL